MTRLNTRHGRPGGEEAGRRGTESIPPQNERGKTGSAKEVIMPRAQIRDEKVYQGLRDKGESKEKSARIANAAAGSSRSRVAKKGGKSGSYDDWSKQDLVQRAREIGIRGRSTMTKAQLVKALRNH